MPPFVAYTCHCRACQKMTSSAFAICMHIPAESLEVTQGSPVTQQRTADDGNILTTHFCGDCGSPLFIANNARPRLRTILVGTLDDPDAVEIVAHIWTSRRLPWVVVPAGQPVFDEGADWRPYYKADPTRLERA
ncbi:MAG: GFA family protein [Gammaproteobacteria bacterium]|nr:GFA family protein [Gammaproteobacteria bacterium]